MLNITVKKCFLRNLKTQRVTNVSTFKSLVGNNFLKISDEIKFSKKPIVALESTIITHGLPYPANLETALQVENEIRTNNATPGNFYYL